MSEEKWKKLEVWQLSNKFALDVYHATKEFPKEELFGLTSQLRRAALSVPTNIVEGHSRSGDKELARFLDIALGSLGEAKYLLFFSRQIGFLSESSFSALDALIQELGSKLYAFFKVVKG
ncbi:MAG: four helix bundle protein [Elusimicrobia bacterium]|nr:four helix bundle protein [Elusimicrobiota bacterium]